MRNVSDVGGGVAPGRRGATVQQTEVARIPMWVPWDQGGAGSWRLVPADTTHGAQLITKSDDAAATGRPAKQAEPLYQGKGFIPEHRAPASALPLLVAKASAAIVRAESEMLPAPRWAVGVLARHPELTAPKKVPVGVGSDAA